MAWTTAKTTVPLLALAFGTVSPATAQLVSATDKWGAHIDVEGKLGTDRSLGEGSFFMPITQTADTLLFTNLRARFDDHSSQEGNFGLGIRRMLTSGWNIGAYGYFDRRRTENDAMFSQVTLGVEALSTDWDLRVNGYVPVGDRSKNVGTTAASATGSVVGTTVQVTSVGAGTVQERSLGGFDAEVGYRLPVFEADADRQIRVYGGFYRFTGEGVSDVTGPRARIDFTIDTVPFLWQGSRLTLGAEIQHDDPRGTQSFAGIRLRIPLQSETPSRSHLTAQEQRMTDTIVRDVDIVSQSRANPGPTKVETATAAADGRSLTVINSASTTGANLAAGVAAAGSNSLVILSGAFNTTGVGTPTVTLQSGQTLTSGGQNITVRTASGITATVTTPSGNASITNNDNGTNAAVIEMAANSTLSNLTVTRNGNANPYAVHAVNAANLTIANNTITSNGTANSGSAFAIGLEGATSTATISNNTITATHATNNGMGLQLFNGASAAVNNNNFTVTGANQHIVLNIIGSGTSTVSGSGNTRNATATCSGTASGQVNFTNGTHCP